MSPLFGRRLARRACVAIFVAVAGVVPGVPAQADTVSVAIDQARVMNMPGQVSTIVIGNPLIADATLQRGGVLIVTGKGYGETNLVALNREGRVLMEKTLQVVGPENVVFVYKGIERESYSCTPECDRRVTLGDSQNFFATTLGQAGSRSGQAAAGNGGGGGPPGR